MTGRQTLFTDSLGDIKMAPSYYVKNTLTLCCQLLSRHRNHGFSVCLFSASAGAEGCDAECGRRVRTN